MTGSEVGEDEDHSKGVSTNQGRDKNYIHWLSNSKLHRPWKFEQFYDIPHVYSQAFSKSYLVISCHSGWIINHHLIFVAKKSLYSKQSIKGGKSHIALFIYAVSFQLTTLVKKKLPAKHLNFQKLYPMTLYTSTTTTTSVIINITQKKPPLS